MKIVEIGSILDIAEESHHTIGLKKGIRTDDREALARQQWRRKSRLSSALQYESPISRKETFYSSDSGKFKIIVGSAEYLAHCAAKILEMRSNQISRSHQLTILHL